MRGRLRPRLRWVHGVLIPLNHVIVDSIFHIPTGVDSSEEPFIVGLIFREQQRDLSLAVQIAFPQLGMRGCNRLRAFLARDLF